MEVELASVLFNWLLHVDPADLACIVCQWDPVSGSYVPYTGAGSAAAAAAAAAAGGRHGADDTPADRRAADADRSGRDQSPGSDRSSSGPLDPHAYQDMSPEERGNADYEENQRRVDRYRRTHPDETTAPPPPSDDGGIVGDAVYTGFFTLGTRSRE